MVWSNAPSQVYHGTNKLGADSIKSSGVDPSYGRGAADFGQGFYVTTDFHQARNWANQKVRSIPPRSYIPRDSYIAAIVSFDLDRDRIGKLGDHLTFVLPGNAFHDFVAFNRFGSSNHGRHKPYDVVYGPVAAYPQTITYTNCDQICFVATIGAPAQLAVAALGSPTGIIVGNPLFP